MEIGCIYCYKCKDLIYSRARHDLRYCSCKSVSVDGGLDCFDGSFTPGIGHQIVILDLPVNKSMLYQDWHHNQTKYGCIKNYPIDEYIKERSREETYEHTESP